MIPKHHILADVLKDLQRLQKPGQLVVRGGDIAPPRLSRSTK